MNKSCKKSVKLKAANILVVASLALGGCSTIYDGIMWAPRKAWAATGDKWFGFHNPQDTDTGQRRRPISNPQGGGASMAYPPSARGVMGIEPAFPNAGAMPQSNNYPAGNYPSAYPSKAAVSSPQSAAQPYPASSSNYPSLGGNSMGEPQQSGQAGAAYGAMPPIPPIPPAYQQSYTGGKTTNPQTMPGDFISAPDATSGIGDEGISADAAYAQGNAGGGSKSKGWSIPFFSGNYKVEAHFEPLSEEFVIAQNVINQPVQAIESEAPDASVLPAASPKNDSKALPDAYKVINKEKAKRTSSMFPLDQYAPKATAEVSTMGTMANGAEHPDSSYPKLGRIPQNPTDISDAKSSAAELNSMQKEAEEMQARKANLANQPAMKLDATKPDMKVNDAPAQIPEKDKKFEKPQSSMWDKVPLVRRRDVPSSSHAINSSGNNTSALAPGALKGDAAIMQEIAPDKKIVAQDKSAKAPEKGFFASLHDKVFPPAPKQVWRKSQPPQVAHENSYGSAN